MNNNASTATNPNATAQSTIINSYVCPSDGANQKLNGYLAYTNYGLPGVDRSPGGGLDVYEHGADQHALGVYIAAVDYSQLPCANGIPNTNYAKVPGVTVAAVTDGTSNTAAFSEYWRGHSTIGTPRSI